VSAFSGSFSELRPYRIWDGAHAHAVTGHNVQFGLIDLEPNIEVPEHSHPNEQLGFILQGKLRFTIGGETRELGPGDTYCIPADLPHQASTGPEGCVAVDIFSPPRADWEALPRVDPRMAAWPPPV
jgi:quercetin dioxygenase-like cupin family protein